MVNTRPSTPLDMDTRAVVAVTLQEADLGDTTTVKETLVEAGFKVAELVEREAEMRPTGEPQIHLGGIEELWQTRDITADRRCRR
jgi:hypothetical protein